MYKIQLKKNAQKYYEKLPASYRNLLLSLFVILAADDWSKLDVEIFEGRPDTFRLRFGKYRCIFEKQNALMIITVIQIGPRGDVYK